ncbi:hypothetical protein [Chroococcidiopsis sp. CCNUC1]|uniref:hypothetical protein n=1 Tax=Chroococcidiopsis sp. CCNUC1 TaxID=2653189 RepID=UPI002021A9FD|nr:hypothetical protein [Chroococcidiopsis sp. CCNUC1]URD53584.1 hypothetical protein M5J74_29900 [Chroococcidiopsis sp. CCNUC1]
MTRKALPSDSIELVRIMRKRDSADGIVISYLQNRRRGQTELACDALRAYYLPLALLDAGVSGEELRDAAIDAIAQLEAQIMKLKQICRLEGMAQVVLVQPMVEELIAESRAETAVGKKEPGTEGCTPGVTTTQEDLEEEVLGEEEERDFELTDNEIDEVDEVDEAQEELPQDESWDAMFQLRL